MSALCSPHFIDTAESVDATQERGGIPVCDSCAKAHDDSMAEPSADESLAGRRFHRHARNCTWCKPVLEAEPGSEAAHPTKLCEGGLGLFFEAAQR